MKICARTPARGLQAPLNYLRASDGGGVKGGEAVPLASFTLDSVGGRCYPSGDVDVYFGQILHAKIPLRSPFLS